MSTAPTDTAVEREDDGSLLSSSNVETRVEIDKGFNSVKHAAELAEWSAFVSTVGRRNNGSSERNLGSSRPNSESQDVAALLKKLMAPKQTRRFVPYDDEHGVEALRRDLNRLIEIVLLSVEQPLNDEARVRLLSKDAQMPTKGTPGSAGWDLFSSSPTFLLPRGARALVCTGLQVRPPAGCYSRIAPRSGLALKGIDVCAGVVDPDYKGELKVILVNLSGGHFEVPMGTRIAQLIFERYSDAPLKLVESEAEVDPRCARTTPSALGYGSDSRGAGGFGSTGQ